MAASPWVVFARKVESLYQYDDEVAVEFDSNVPKLTLLVENSVKAASMSKIIGTKREFGNVTLEIEIVPANDEPTISQVIRQAFDGNPVLSNVIEVDDHGGMDTFALFAPAIAQFRSDDISSPYGITTMTYEQIARDVLDVNAFISTDVVDE